MTGIGFPADPYHCHACYESFYAVLRQEPPPLDRMIICETCGNKRCPKATDHRLSCTKSNELWIAPSPGALAIVSMTAENQKIKVIDLEIRHLDEDAIIVALVSKEDADWFKGALESRDLIVRYGAKLP